MKFRFPPGPRSVASAFAALCATTITVIATATFFGIATAHADPPVISVDQGLLRGIPADGITKYLGVPFATASRFESPFPAAPWSGVLEASHHGPQCPQTAPSLQGSGEDCLNIDIYAPANAADRNLPVMVWLYGGAFILGANNQYDSPSSLVSRGDVIVAVPNYRTGPFGFLALPELADEASGGTGNYAIEDQQEALRWVQRNIANFGGDPRNVTIFGESAGGASVCTQIASPKAAGLFSKAIVQSGTCARSMLQPPTKEVAYQRSERYADGVGCGNPDTRLSCLRSLPGDKLLDSPTLGISGMVGNITWTPVVDGVTLVDTPEIAMRSGAGKNIRMLVGSNTNEGSTFVAALDYGSGRVPTESSYHAFLETLFGNRAGTILEQYPASKYPSPGDTEGAVMTDSQFACPSLWTVEAASHGGTGGVWQYQFAEAPIPANSVIAGAFHGADVPYIFSGMLGIPIPWTGPSLNFAHQLQSQWATFAHSGSPNAEGLPFWPEWNPQSTPVLQTSVSSSLTNTNFAAEHKCEFWSGI